MRKLLCLLLAATLLLTACQSEEEVMAPKEEVPTDKQESTVKEESVIEEIDKELHWAEGFPLETEELPWTVYTSSAVYLQELCDPKYEGRAAGSSGNRAAADWIEEQFVGMGLQMYPSFSSYRHSFNSDVFEMLPGYAAIVSADGTETELELGVEWTYTPSYEELDLTLPLSENMEDCKAGKAFLDATATKQDYPRRELSVVSSDLTTNTGHFSGDGHENKSRIKVLPEVYEKLKEEGSKLHIKLPMAAQKGKAENIIAYLPGENSEHAVLLCAHFDGSGQSGRLMPSAYDNASGMATLLQTASWLSKADSLPCDVIIAAFNSEEIGLVGSEAFAVQLKSKYEQISVINIDCVGWKDEAHVIYAENSQGVLRNDLSAALKLQYMGVDYASDHMSFREANMRSVLISQEANYSGGAANRISHSYRDTVDNLDTDSMDELAKKLCIWVLERGDLSFSAYVVIW